MTEACCVVVVVVVLLGVFALGPGVHRTRFYVVVVVWLWDEQRWSSWPSELAVVRGPLRSRPPRSDNAPAPAE